MNIWHDLDPSMVSPDNFTAVIEIPKGSNTKYELDKATGPLRLDRILEGKETAVDSVKDRDVALRIISEARARYDQCFR
ncbi:MAG: hypothetical protein GX091_01380 [Peptococcaceae bacterium]|nr:hypothetical protein [Peptococcaceae bacterium]